MLASTVFYLEKRSRSTYDITHTKSGKEHAIIQIVSDGGKGFCTAFVISDEIALTAGHCIGVSKFDVDNTIKKEIESIKKQIKLVKRRIKNLETCLSTQCQTMISMSEFELETLRDAIKELKKRKPDVFEVRNIYGEDTKIKAVAELATRLNSDYRDYGILRGDFKRFEKIPIRRGFHVREGDLLRSCGYAGGYRPPVCTNFVAKKSYGFMFYGEGLLIRGMSGGPVIDSQGYAVGINSAVEQHKIIIEPLIGMFDLEFKRPIKEKHGTIGPTPKKERWYRN